MPRLLAPFLLALVLACPNDRSADIGPPDRSAVGSYELAFCRQPCRFEDTANAVIRGFLVLDSVGIAIPDSQQDYFEVVRPFSIWVTDLHHAHLGGACFALHEPGRPRTNSAGMPMIRGYPAVAVTSWQYAADSSGLEFELLRSPDASFRIKARLSGGRVAGRARAGGMLGEQVFGVGYVVGRRVGKPDPSLCFRAAPARWAADTAW